jgi:hypothetical protein
VCLGLGIGFLLGLGLVGGLLLLDSGFLLGLGVGLLFGLGLQLLLCVCVC